MSTKIPDRMLKNSAVRVLLQRAAAEVGFNLVAGSCEEGAILINSNDVVWYQTTGRYYQPVSYPQTVMAGFNPVTSGWTDKTDKIVISWQKPLSATDGATLVGEAFFGGTVQDFISGKTGYLSNIVSLRSSEPLVNGQILKIKGHTNDGVGGGEFEADFSDTTTSDDNGWTIVTPLGKRWKRRNTKGIYLDDFGLLDGGSLDTPLSNALATAALKNITTVFIPTNSTDYTLVGGITKVIPNCDIEIKGMGGSYFTSRISHTGNNIGVTFTKGASLFNRAVISGVCVTGNAGTSACFAEFQDSWNCGAKDIYVSGYSTNTVFSIHNKTGRTDGFWLENIMSRGNKTLVYPHRSSSTGGIYCFFGMKWRDVWHQFGVNNSRIMEVAPASAADSVKIYGADLEFGGWFETGGGHRAIRIGTNAGFVDSVISTKLDGFGGLSDGSDMYVIEQSGTGIVDITAKMLNQQGGYTDISALTTGTTLAGFKHSLTPATLYAANYGRNLARVRGAQYRWAQAVTTDKTFTITNLPCFSSFRAKLRVIGTNVEYAETYQIDTHGINNLARVTSLSATNQNGNFKLRVFNNGSGGASSTGNGGKVDWLHLAAAQGGQQISASLEIEMM